MLTLKLLAFKLKREIAEYIYRISSFLLRKGTEYINKGEANKLYVKKSA